MRFAEVCVTDQCAGDVSSLNSGGGGSLGLRRKNVGRRVATAMLATKKIKTQDISTT